MNEPEKKLKEPAIGEFLRGSGILVKTEIIQPPPPKPYTDYIFEEQDARCELRHNGKTVKHIQTLNDFYGIGTGVETAIKEMKEYATKEEITDKSDLEVVVIKVVSQHRKTRLTRESFYNPGYSDFDWKERGSTLDLPEPIETIVWSSKNE